MEGEALVAIEPGAHLGVLVGSIVVEDDVHRLVGGNLGVDGVEKADGTPDGDGAACSCR